MKTVTIHHKGFHTLNLNNNELSGNTFPLRDYIKGYLGGKWNAERKTWAIDIEKLVKFHGHTIEDAAPVASVAKTGNGLCPHCHTYCYGDCKA